MTVWSPFLPRPTETLKARQTIVGLHCFDSTPELITVDIGGRVCIWDSRLSCVVQTLGAADSLSPIGTTCSMAYNTQQHAIVCLGDRQLNMFLPQKGAYSALIDSSVSCITYDSVHKRIIVPCGGRILIFEMTTGELRHMSRHWGCGDFARCGGLAASVDYRDARRSSSVTQIGLWQTTASLQLKGTVRLVQDLGRKRR